MARLDLTDRFFGRLKAIRPTDKRAKDGSIIWECLCECGKQVEVSSSLLATERKRSCGCLTSDLQRKRIHDLKEKNFVEGTDIGSIKNKNVYSSNTSGVRGVYFFKRDQKWSARITFQGKTYFLGYFDKLEDAKEVRKEAEKRIFDDFLEWYQERENKK